MTAVTTTQPETDLRATLASIRTEAGSSLLALTESSPVLLIFLRHFGCSFCRQAISDIADMHDQLAARGARPVFVHLGTPERAKPYFDYYGLSGVERISDPDAAIYHHSAFSLVRMHPALNLIKPRVWLGWLQGSIVKHGIGTFKEDAHQMPGLFLLRGPRIVRRYQYKSIADRPNYVKFAS